jgi:hypothetical protein
MIGKQYREIYPGSQRRSIFCGTPETFLIQNSGRMHIQTPWIRIEREVEISV